MKKNEFEFALEALNSGKPVIIGTVIRQFGSSPRGKGARIVIDSEGNSIGSVGGGQQEAVIQAKKNSIIGDKCSKLVEFILPEKVDETPDLRCGGNVAILLETVFPDQIELVSLIRDTSNLIHQNQRGWLLSKIPDASNEKSPVGICLISPNGKISGNIDPDVKFENQLLKSISLGDFVLDFSENPISIKEAQEIIIGEQLFFIEPVGQFSAAYIIGAGHVAQRLSYLAQFVGFRTTVMDDRSEFLSKENFPEIDELILLPDFHSVFTHARIDKDSFVICVTRGHMLDKMVLSQALGTTAGYIGMIGSRKKVETIFTMLEKEGFPMQDFERVHTPIGLSIGAETPEEIAVSIVAEMIQVRAHKSE